MADPTSTIVISASTAGAIVLTGLRWMFNRQVATNDEHAARIAHLERENVTKDDITQVERKVDARLDAISSTIAEGFKENQRTLDAAHRRVDDIYRDMNKRPT